MNVSLPAAADYHRQYVFTEPFVWHVEMCAVATVCAFCIGATTDVTPQPVRLSHLSLSALVWVSQESEYSHLLVWHITEKSFSLSPTQSASVRQGSGYAGFVLSLISVKL